jgi:O-antigen/teichoic acid export membrane protein
MILLDQAIVSATSFATTVVVGRVGGPEELAIYALAATLLVLAGNVHEALVSQPYTVYLHRMPAASRATFLGSAFASTLGLAAAVALGVAAFGLLLPTETTPAGLSSMLIALTAVAPCWLLREFARKSAIAHLAFASALRLDVAVAVVHVGTLAWLAVTHRLSGLSALVAVAAGPVAGATWWLLASRHQLRWRPRRAFSDWRRNWRLGRWILANRVAVHFNSDIAVTWLLAFLSGPGAVGILTGCLTLVALSNPITIGVGLCLTPRIAQIAAKGGDRAAREAVRQWTLGLAVVLGTFVTALTLLAGPLMTLMYGREFAGHDTTVVVLAIAVALSAVGMAAGAGLLARERADLNLASSVAGALTLVAAAPALIGLWNAFGAGLALCAGSAMQTGARLLLFFRDTRMVTHAHLAEPVA